MILLLKDISILHVLGQSSTGSDFQIKQKLCSQEGDRNLLIPSSGREGRRLEFEAIINNFVIHLS